MTQAHHLVVSISGHGYGHVAQTAPILNTLYGLYPQLRMTVRSAVAEQQLRSRIHVPFTLLQSSGDIGMAMTSPLEVDIENSRASYQTFHANWDERIAMEAHLLRELEASLVLSNVGYLPLAGAQRAGIANAALCSLNWADIYRHYCGDGDISRQIHSCYANADAFMRATPGMAMNDLPNVIAVAPIAAVGTNRRNEINRHLGLAGDERLLLVSMGGIASHLPVEAWPRIDGLRYLVQANWSARHPDAIAFESIPVNFSDLLASSDALLCKPGYGSFVEAACSGTAVLYVSRSDWPESPALTDWMKQHGTCREIPQQALLQGNFGRELEQLLIAPKPQAVIPAGAEQAARWLMEKLCA